MNVYILIFLKLIIFCLKIKFFVPFHAFPSLNFVNWNSPRCPPPGEQCKKLLNVQTTVSKNVCVID